MPSAKTVKLLSHLPAGLRSRLFVAAGLATRAMTLGVKAFLTDGERLLLVRHTYVPGWHLPGGGVERHETVWQAVEKEVREETHLRLETPAELFGIYKNERHSRFDHIAFFVCRGWREAGAFEPNAEIAECRWFAFDDLPEGTTQPTRARLAEVTGGQPIAERW